MFIGKIASNISILKPHVFLFITLINVSENILKYTDKLLELMRGYRIPDLNTQLEEFLGYQ